MSRADAPKRIKIARRVVALWKGGVTAEEPLAQALGIEGGPLRTVGGDVIVTIGGDGTILHALRERDLPVLAVNDGRVGFLTELEINDLDEGLKRLAAGDYQLEERHRLRARLGNQDLGPFLNEAALKTPRPSKILTFNIQLDDHLVDTVRADGMVLATATGSTGYALSGGGPLVEPTVPVTLIVPLAPFRLSTRAIVLPSTTKVTVVQTDEGKETVMSLDGRPEVAMKPGVPLQISGHPVPARFVRFAPHFTRRMKELLR